MDLNVPTDQDNVPAKIGGFFSLRKIWVCPSAVVFFALVVKSKTPVSPLIYQDASLDGTEKKSNFHFFLSFSFFFSFFSDNNVQFYVHVSDRFL